MGPSSTPPVWAARTPTSGNAIAVDTAGNAYVTGFTFSDNFPIMGALQRPCSGTQDAFVTKLNTTTTGQAALVYSTCLGGKDADQGNAIAVDTAGNAYVTGTTESDDFPRKDEPLDALPVGTNRQEDAFVTKLNTTTTGQAALVYSFYLAGDKIDNGNGIAVDTACNVYVTGLTESNREKSFPLQKTFPLKMLTNHSLVGVFRMPL